MTPLLHSETITTPATGWGSNPPAGLVPASGTRFRIIDSYLDGLSEYTHDDTNQLVGADHNTADDEAYEYDANGNRIMGSYVIHPNNQLYSDGTYIYTYDDEGNRETRTKISNSYVTRYYWDHRNRMVKVEEYDAGETTLLSSVEQTYDPFNQWIRRSFDEDGTGGDPAVDTFFVYENGQIVLEFDDDDDTDLTHRYLWGEAVDQLFADETVTSLGSAGTMIWPLGDHLGTMRDLVTYNSGTDDASIANHREYDSFGKLADESNSGMDLLFGFTSRPLDSTTDEQNNGSRWYSGQTARWLSDDPIGFFGADSNLSRYVKGAPLQHTDASGLVDDAQLATWIARLGDNNWGVREQATADLISKLTSPVFMAELATYVNAHPITDLEIKYRLEHVEQQASKNLLLGMTVNISASVLVNLDKSQTYVPPDGFDTEWAAEASRASSELVSKLQKGFDDKMRSFISAFGEDWRPSIEGEHYVLMLDQWKIENNGNEPTTQMALDAHALLDAMKSKYKSGCDYVLSGSLNWKRVSYGKSKEEFSMSFGGDAPGGPDSKSATYNLTNPYWD